MASIKINGKEYPMALTTRALKVIGEKFGGLGEIGSTLYEEEKIEKKLDMVVELTALLINEAAARHNIFEPQEPKWDTVSVEFLEIATAPADLAMMAPAIRDALTEGTARSVESESEKN